MDSSPSVNSPDFLMGTTILGCCFLVLFTAFSGSQNLQSSLYADMGSNCLAIIYIFYALAALVIATPLVEKIGPRLGLGVGAATYTAFQVANLYPREYTLYPTAAIMGVGASILWTSQGVYQTRCSTSETSGKHSGVFWAIFQWSQITGNLMSSLVLHQANATVLFTIFSVCGGVSTFLMLLLPNRESTESKDTSQPKMTTSELVRHMFRLMRTNILLKLPVPTYVWSGVSMGLFFAWFTANWITVYLGKNDVGYVMCVFGALDITFSALLGWASDSVGRSGCLLLSTVCILAGLMDIAIRYGDSVVPYWEICIVAGLFGVGDAGYNTMIQSYLSGSLGKHSVVVFSVYRTIQSLFGAIAIFTINKMHTLVVVYTCAALVAIGYLFFAKADQLANKMVDEEERIIQTHTA